jgi:hypothetical protein
MQKKQSQERKKQSTPFKGNQQSMKKYTTRVSGRLTEVESQKEKVTHKEAQVLQEKHIGLRSSRIAPELGFLKARNGDLEDPVTLPKGG